MVLDGRSNCSALPRLTFPAAGPCLLGFGLGRRSRPDPQEARNDSDRDHLLPTWAGSCQLFQTSRGADSPHRQLRATTHRRRLSGRPFPTRRGPAPVLPVAAARTAAHADLVK